MPSTPTITVTGYNTLGFNRIVVDNGGTPPTYNDVYRNGVKIGSQLRVNGVFTDWNVASGVTNSYIVRAVDSGSADSAAATASVTLSSGVLHAVDKTKKSTNAVAVLALALLDVEPYSARYEFAAASYSEAGGDVIDTQQGQIQTVTVGLTAIVPLSNDRDRQILRALFKTNAYLCLRNATGGLWFGRLNAQYSERYQDLLTEIPILFEKLDFSEAVA